MEEHINIDKLLESIVFDKANLTDLKIALNKVKKGQISVNELGKTILELRVRILTTLKGLFPFHLKLANTQHSLEEFTDSSSHSPQLAQELEEKNKLLETISARIKRIFESLNSSEDGI
ncbi:MAG: hypothetical protein ACFFDF_06735 [Candidatus Odinarchaeota archaeon]